MITKKFTLFSTISTCINQVQDANDGYFPPTPRGVANFPVGLVKTPPQSPEIVAPQVKYKIMLYMCTHNSELNKQL